MHAEDKLFLSKLVLAKALGIEQGKLRSKVLWPLGEEAAADVVGEMVFTRHRAIAEMAFPGSGAPRGIRQPWIGCA